MAAQSSSNSLITSSYESIEQLQLELSRCLSLQSTLEDETTALLQSISPGPCGSLSVLPPELLIEIFNALIAENLAHIGPLMLVCRLWHRAIVETPKFWTNIQISVPFEAQKVKRCVSYCARCVERSGSLPLDIDIRYTNFCAVPGHLWKQILTACVATFSDIQVQTCWESPFIRKLSVFLEALDRGDDAFYKYHRERYLAPLRVLSGEAFSVMARWRSFAAVAGKINWHRTIFTVAYNENLFGGRTPLLERLVLRHKPNDLRPIETGHDCFPFADSKPHAFPFMPKIRKLFTINVSLPLHFENIDPKGITGLSLHTQSLFPLTCNNITILRLGFTDRRNHLYTGIPTDSVIFPFLKRLEINVHFTDVFWERIITPVLDILVLEGRSYLGFRNVAVLPPSITRVECRWSGAPMGAGLMQVLPIILQCPSLNTLLFTSIGRKAMIKVIRHLKKRRIISSVLPTLLVVPYDWETDPMYEEIVELGED